VENLGVLTHRVAVYLHTAEGWSTRPSEAQPLTDIGCDGTFSVEVFTGEGDLHGDRVFAAVVTEDFLPPVLSGAESLPRVLLERAVTKTELVR